MNTDTLSFEQAKALITNGAKFKATKDLPHILYNYSNGGGINGRTIKEGDIVTTIGTTPDVGSWSVSTREVLYRMELNGFLKCFELVN